jgi:hypothetical protein
MKTLTTLFRECFVALESFHFVRWKGWTEEQEKTFLNGMFNLNRIKHKRNCYN